MNCLDFRRAKLADPRRLPSEARSHASTCAACSAFAREFEHAERLLQWALEVPVPEGLAERILYRSRTPQRPWRSLAVAASILAALAAGFALGASRQTGDVYARLAIEHVAMEPEALASGLSADPKALQAVLRDFGGTLRELPGRIVYFECCPVADGLVWHAVFETPQGRATLILAAGVRLPRAQTATTARWSALAEPVRGGYYAIVTESQAGTAAFEKALRASVAWEA